MIYLGSTYFEPNRLLFFERFSVFELSPQKIQAFTDFIQVYQLNYLDIPQVFSRYLLDLALINLALTILSLDILLHVKFKL